MGKDVELSGQLQKMKSNQLENFDRLNKYNIAGDDSLMLPSVAARHIYCDKPYISPDELRKSYITATGLSNGSMVGLTGGVVVGFPACMLIGADNVTAMLLVLLASVFTAGVPTFFISRRRKANQLEKQIAASVIQFNKVREKALNDVNSNADYARLVELSYKANSCEEKEIVDQFFVEKIRSAKFDTIFNKLELNNPGSGM